MQRTQIQLTEGQAKRLRSLAAQRGVSMAVIVREALEAYVSQADEDPRGRALAHLGGFRSGLADVSERHDDYLAEAAADDNVRR